jgi:hypothetical protein
MVFVIKQVFQSNFLTMCELVLVSCFVFVLLEAIALFLLLDLLLCVPFARLIALRSFCSTYCFAFLLLETIALLLLLDMVFCSSCLTYYFAPLN